MRVLLLLLLRLLPLLVPVLVLVPVLALALLLLLPLLLLRYLHPFFVGSLPCPSLTVGKSPALPLAGCSFLSSCLSRFCGCLLFRC